MTIDDILNPAEIVCPHCGKVCEYDELFPVEDFPVDEFGDVLPPEKRLQPSPGWKKYEFDSRAPMQPREITYWMDHRVDVGVDGDLDRVEATRTAIAKVREYMKTMPEGYRLVQACPKRMILLEDAWGEEETRWVVRCIMVRQSRDKDLEWIDLLDDRDGGSPF